jgi:hypothetical protein
LEIDHSRVSYSLPLLTLPAHFSLVTVVNAKMEKNYFLRKCKNLAYFIVITQSAVILGYKFSNILVYLLTAIGLTLGGRSTVHSYT